MARSTPKTAALLAAVVLVAGCTSKDESCPSGQTSCRGICRELASDEQGCGTCGNVCATGATCTAGTCACPAGQEACHGACVDLASYATDPASCGACGISCGVGTCAGGACQCGAFIPCPSQVPRCVDGLNDAGNCGVDAAACGHGCPLANAVCDAGACTCPAGTTPCPVSAPTACVDLQTDEASCGTCGTRCAAGATCTSGECLCPPGQSPCEGVCVDRQTDGSNCGTCGWTCADGATCTAGSCACPAEQPTTCAPAAGAGGTCCAGYGCCPSDACQTQHTNGVGIAGLGQPFFDCLPLGTYDLGQAQKAASAWQPSGQGVSAVELGCASQACFGWRTGSACAVWCYGGTADPLRGRASLDTLGPVCVCPTAGSPNWN